MQGHFFCLGSHKVVDDVTEGEIAKKLENTTKLTYVLYQSNLRLWSCWWEYK